MMQRSRRGSAAPRRPAGGSALEMAIFLRSDGRKERASGKRRSRDVFSDDRSETLFGGLGHQFGIGNQGVGQRRAAFALRFGGHGFDSFAENALRVFGVLVEGGDDL